MALVSRFKSAARNLFRKKDTERALDEEISAYAVLATDGLVSSGMSATVARRTVLAELGGIEQVKQRVRDQREGAVIELFGQDVRYALRQLRRNLGFTFTAVVTLAPGRSAGGSFG